MRVVSIIILSLATLFAFVSPTLAVPPNNPNLNNPNIVAYYPGPNDVHGIPQETEEHRGADLVIKSGNSNNFQQFFYGTSTSEGTHGEHTTWNYVGTDPNYECPPGWDLYPDDYGGDYLTEGYYCVKTNDYAPSP